MNKTLAGLVSAAAMLAAGLVLMMSPAPAMATNWGVPVTGSERCSNAAGWYVNPDEAALAPVQKDLGFLFDGPSLVHHETGPLDLADVRAGSFTGTLKGGVLPLFKMETSNPYTTINVTADGKFWATAMLPGDEGGMNHPVATAAALVGLPTKPGKPQLTSDTKVTTFGIGYATDTGNTYLAKTITFRGVTYALSCLPTLSASPVRPGKPEPTATTGPRPTKPAPVTPGPRPSTSSTPVPPVGGGSGGTAELAMTGAPAGLLIGGGVAMIVIGAALLVIGLRSRTAR